jgi:hypothetical protein
VRHKSFQATVVGQVRCYDEAEHAGYDPAQLWRLPNYWTRDGFPEGSRSHRRPGRNQNNPTQGIPSTMRPPALTVKGEDVN